MEETEDTEVIRLGVVATEGVGVIVVQGMVAAEEMEDMAVLVEEMADMEEMRDNGKL